MRKKGEYTASIQNSISRCARDGYHNYRHIFNELLNLNAKVTNIELEKGKKKQQSENLLKLLNVRGSQYYFVDIDCNSMSSMTA